MKPWVHHDSLATQGYSLIRISLCYPTLIWNVATEPTAIIIGVTQKQSMKVSVAMPNLSLFFQCMCVFVCLLPLHYEALYSLYSQCSASRPQVSHWGSEKVKVFSSRFGCQKSWSLQTWKAWGTSWWYKACVIWDPPPPFCLHNKGLVADQMLWQHPWVSLRHRDS